MFARWAHKNTPESVHILQGKFIQKSFLESWLVSGTNVREKCFDYEQGKWRKPVPSLAVVDFPEHS